MNHIVIRNIVLLLVANLASTSFLDGVDYKQCALFFNNDAGPDGSRTGYRKTGEFFSPFVPQRFRYIPFTLTKDGTISTENHDVTNIATQYHGNGEIKQQAIEYMSPTLEALESFEENEDTPRDRNVQVIIKRDIYGNITEIIEGKGLVPDADNDKEIDRMREKIEKPELAFAYKGTSTRFEVLNNQCVPMKQSVLLVRKNEDEYENSEIVIFDTRLCRSIHAFLKEHRESLSVFDSELNGQMATLFAEKARYLLSPEDKERQFLSNEIVDEMVNNNVTSPANLSLRLRVLTGFIAYTQVDSLKQKHFGVSPIVSAYQIQGTCFYQGLSYFMWNDSVWRGLSETKD